MKKRIFTIIIILLFIINVVLASFFIFTFTAIDLPKIKSSVEITNLTENEITIKAQIQMHNSNFFSIIIHDFHINAKTKDGKDIGAIRIKGGKIEPNKEKTFDTLAVLNLENYDFEPINATINGSIGLDILGLLVRKIPIRIDVKVAVDTIIENINPPEVTISAQVDDVTKNGITFTGNITLKNKNSFEIYLSNTTTTITSDEGKELGSIIIPNSYIKSKETKDIQLSANLSYEALGEKKIILNVKTKVGARIAGFNKTLNISTKAEIDVPDIKQLIFLNEIMDITIGCDFNLRLNGVETIVGLQVYNPTEIPFEATNLVCSISGMTNNESILIAEGPMNPCDLSSQEQSCVRATIIMKYIDIIRSGGGKLVPDWYVLSVVGDFSIKNTNQSIPISINANIDPNPFL